MQYPDTIVIVGSSAYTQDTEGDFVTGVSGNTFTSDCRGEPAGDNPAIRGEDGDILVYSWVVYMPKTTVKFVFGDKVTLTKDDGSVYESFVKSHYNGQLNSRVWV